MPARGRNYEMAARQVAAALGLAFAELPEYGCCGYGLPDGSDLEEGLGIHHTTAA